MNGVVTRLFIHPVKSLAAVEVESAEALSEGLRHDRRWMIVDEAGGFVSQREVPSMATITAQIEGGALVLSAGRDVLRVGSESCGRVRAVTVWEDTFMALEASNEANAFVSTHLGRSCALVKMMETRTPESVRHVDSRYANSHETVGFADGFPYLVVSEESVQALEERIDRSVDVRRFRPNVVVAGAGAFAEDAHERMEVASLTFRLVKPCARCVMVNVDPDDGSSSPELLRALATFRRSGNKVLFAMNAIVLGTGSVTRGDAVRFTAPRTPPY